MLKKCGLKFFIGLFSFLNFWSTKAQNNTTQSSVLSFIIDAPQLNSTKKIWIYLPKEYQKKGAKFPVIYMHDGQNLFDTKTSYNGEWAIDETLDSLNARVIVVGIEHGGDKRIDELTPFKNAKYGGGNADNYLDFIVNTLKPYIDANYKTKTTAKNTCLFGSSLGGLVSFYGAIKYPEIFGKVGCFSPSFWINRNEIFELIDTTKNYKTKIYFLCGDDEGDDDMIRDLNNMEYKINSKRCKCNMLNKKVIIKNGQHNEKLWREGFRNAYLWLF